MAINAIGAQRLGPRPDRRQLPLVHAFPPFVLYSGGKRVRRRKSVILGRVLPNLRAAVPPIFKLTAPWTTPHFRVPTVSFCPPSTPQSVYEAIRYNPFWMRHGHLGVLS